MALQKISSIVSTVFPWKELTERLGKNQTVLLEHFVGSTSSIFINELARKHDQIVAIFPDDESAQFLKSDLDELNTNKPLHFPPTNRKPYDKQQILDSALMVQRSEVLDHIQSATKCVTVTSAAALFEKIVAPETFKRASILINKGDSIEPDELQRTLLEQQYRKAQFVDEPGEFASRGGIMDIFPFSGEYPVRLEFFGNDVDSIRQFDPDSQRSISHMSSTRIVPDATNLEMGEKRGLLDYFSETAVFILFNHSLISSDLQERFNRAKHTYEKINSADTAIPDDHFTSPDAFACSLENRPLIQFGGFASPENIDWSFRLEAAPQPDFNGSINLLKKDIRDRSIENFDTYILCDNEGQRDRFEQLLDEPDEYFRYNLSVETLHEGFILKEKKIAVFTDHQIFNRYHRPKIKKRRYHGGLSFRELRDLRIGDYVVHVDYGIGTFAGFRTIKIKGVEQESVVLKYKEDSVLYVNVSSLHKLQKYSGKEGTKPRITKLGSGQWARKKEQTKRKVKDIARDLIKLYAERKSRKAHAYSADTSWQTELEAQFEFEETPDQKDAIEAVKKDMENPIPMDRLVCGDVGFGKTEVALRAAFKAVTDHKQVAILVPTTILADQHYHTFSERMEQFPITVEMISRFRSAKEQKEIIKKIADGTVDIIIGTHRITSSDIKFDDLGLLIIDEEQRFGVAAKEKLKKYRATVDVLTLTATPIPRTLQFSLMGARDLSIINTPPPNRQPVRTEIHSFDETLIQNAILQEMSRGGQVFFIHNRVKNIESMTSMIRQLVPDVRVRFAHGQMSSSRLEKIITDFYQHKFDVLVSTNIVENGIDIANANTMIINRADRFGMAELHQLRGRVGRSNRKAYCYLITPPVETLTAEARKRLLALEEFSDLGSGFNLAMRDLDIRGAGDILGAEQSGFINDVGFELYHKILNDAVRELKEDEFSEVFKDTEEETVFPETIVEFDRPALIPSDYVLDNVERLNLYRKLAKAATTDEIDDWREEIKDRFGTLPKQVYNLITAAKIKLIASFNYFSKVTIRSNRMWLKCPGSNTEMGEEFYGYRFQKLLKILQQSGEERFKVVQKKDTIRFVIHEIPDIATAEEFLETLNTKVSDQMIPQTVEGN